MEPLEPEHAEHDCNRTPEFANIPMRFMEPKDAMRFYQRAVVAKDIDAAQDFSRLVYWLMGEGDWIRAKP